MKSICSRLGRMITALASNANMSLQWGTRNDEATLHVNAHQADPSLQCLYGGGQVNPAG